jgi:WD40 repeat protein
MQTLTTLALALVPQVADPELESYLAHVAASHASLRLGDAQGLRRWLDGAPQARRGFEWKWLSAESDGSLASVALEKPAYAFALAPGAERAFLAHDDGTVLGLELATGATRVTTLGHARFAMALDVDAGGERVLSAAQDGTVTIWDADSGEGLVRFAGHNLPVGGAAFAPDGALVATSSYRRDPERTVVGLVLLWDSATGEIVRRLEAGNKPIVDVRFSSDGRFLAAATWGFVVYLWDLESGDDEPRVLPMPEEGIYNAVDDVAFSPDGRRVAGASKDRTARVWATATGELVFTLRGHDNDVTSLSWSPDGKVIATGSADATLRLWSAADGAPRGVLRGHRARVDDVGFASDGSLWSAAADGTLRRWDAGHADHGGVERKTSAACYAAVFSPDGAQMATASFDGRIQVWETRGWSETSSWQAHPSGKSCHALAWSPDGARLYSGSHDATVAVWDARTHAEVARLEQKGSVQWLALAPAGDVLAVALTGTAWLWDTAGGTKRGEVAGLGSSTSDLAFTSDGARLALTNRDRSVRVVDVATLAELWRVDHESEPSAVAFSPDDAWLAYSLGGEVHLVDTATWRAGARIVGGENTLNRLAWSPDGTRLVTTSMDGSFAVTDSRPIRLR